MSDRSQKIVPTVEGRILREMRLRHKLSLTLAAEKAGGISPSMIAHIETGRANAPSEAVLAKLLAVYGGTKVKSFYERVRNFKEKRSAKEELKDMIAVLTEEQAKLIAPMVKALLGQSR